MSKAATLLFAEVITFKQFPQLVNHQWKLFNNCAAKVKDNSDKITLRKICLSNRNVQQSVQQMNWHPFSVSFCQINEVPLVQCKILIRILLLLTGQSMEVLRYLLTSLTSGQLGWLTEKKTFKFSAVMSIVPQHKFQLLAVLRATTSKHLCVNKHSQKNVNLAIFLSHVRLW